MSSELRYNNESGTLGAALTSSATTITFAPAPDFATITGGNYIKLVLDIGTTNYEIVYLTAYTANATTGTIARAQEDSTNWPAVSHAQGATWVCAPTVNDFDSTRSATITIAASNSSTAGKAAADYVCTGSSDETIINAAVSAVATEGNGGRVLLLEGFFNCTGPVNVDANNIILEGQGAESTTIGCPTNGLSRLGAILIGVTKIVTLSGVKNLSVNGNGGSGSTPVSGGGHGIIVACNQPILENVYCLYPAKDGVHFSQDSLNPAAQTTVATTTAVGATSLPLTSAAAAGITNAFGAVIIQTAAGNVYATYTGLSSNTLTGFSANFPPGVTSLPSGSVVYAAVYMFDITASNVYVLYPGGNGFFVDWAYGSCEFFACRVLGGTTKTGATNKGFLIYGSLVKLVACHPYLCGIGLQVDDVNVYTGGWVQIIGGEYETCTTAGILDYYNNGNLTIVGANFYGNGLSSAGSDIALGSASASGSTAVRIVGCRFDDSGTGSSVGQQIYITGATNVRVSDCTMSYASLATHILIDGTTAACSDIQVTGTTATSGAANTFVNLKGATTYSEISGNHCDGTIVETTATGTPNYNRVFENTLIQGYTPVITIVGANSQAYYNQGDGAAPALNFGTYYAPPVQTNVGDYTTTSNLLYYAQIVIPVTTTLTGIAVLNQSVVSGNILVALYNAAGTEVASSASVALSGTYTAQQVPFSATYSAKPGIYFVACMYSGASHATFNGILSPAGVAAQGGFTLPGTITPPTAGAATVAAMSTY